MVVDYTSMEDRLFKILLEHLTERKHVDLNGPSLIEMYGSEEILVNYHPDEAIWFYRTQNIKGFRYYYFGFKDDNEIKLRLQVSNVRSSSYIDFFGSGKIALKVKYTKEGTKIFDSMRKIFKIKNPLGKVVKYNYIMLILDDESELIPEITKFMDLINFEYGKGYLLVKGFKENIDDDYINNLIESEKSINEDNLEDKDDLKSEDDVDDSNINEMERKEEIERYISQSGNYEFSVEETISNIDCNDFNGESSASEDLGEKFEELVKSPILSIICGDLDDNERSKLIAQIKDDLDNDKITGDVGDILDFYLEQYNSMKKEYSLNNFLNGYIKSDDFNRILNIYDTYTADMICGIIDHVRQDISSDDTMDNDKIILKVEYYFKAERNKNEYLIQFYEIKSNSDYYQGRYNLTSGEFGEILNYIRTRIIKGYHIKNIRDCLLNKINEKVDLNRDESRLKLKRLLNDPGFIEDNNITQEQLNQISEHVGNLIYNNKIRSDEIYEDTLLAIRRRF